VGNMYSFLEQMFDLCPFPPNLDATYGFATQLVIWAIRKIKIVVSGASFAGICNGDKDPFRRVHVAEDMDLFATLWIVVWIAIVGTEHSCFADCSGVVTRRIS